MSFHKGILGQSTGGASVKEQTLGDYINRIVRSQALDDVANERKLTFEEWLEKDQVNYRSVETRKDLEYYLSLAWKAAQENK